VYLGYDAPQLEIEGRHFSAGSLFDIGCYLSALQTRRGPGTEMHLLDLDCTATLHALPGKTTSTVYVMGFFKPEQYHDAFIATPGVTEYCYWDNTDRPDDISCDDWAKRGQVWCSVLGASGIPSQEGFVIDMLPATAALHVLFRDVWGAFLERAPSLEERTERARRYSQTTLDVTKALKSTGACAAAETTPLVDALPPLSVDYLRGGKDGN
jgi:hypothetical protein